MDGTLSGVVHLSPCVGQGSPAVSEFAHIGCP